MGRYYNEDEPKNTDKEKTVFNITDDVINKVKRKQNFIPHKHKANKYKKERKKTDPYPGRKPIDEDALERHKHGDGVETGKVKTKFKQKEQKRREEKIQFAEEQSARTEMFLHEDAGYLEGDLEQEFTAQIKQVTPLSVFLTQIICKKAVSLCVPRSDFSEITRILTISQILIRIR